MPVRPGYGPPTIGRPKPGGRRPYVAAIGGLPPAATVIPWTWLQTPLELRTQQPINSASVSRNNGATVTSNNLTSQATYGVFAVAGSLDTNSTDDAGNLAAFLTTYYANPLLRAPVLTLSLVYRTDAERATILGVEIGTRITLGQGTVQDFPGHTTILPVPPGLPPGAVSSVVEGIQHTSSVTDRIVEWTTVPLLGSAPGIEGTWFRLDTSVVNGADVIPF